MTKYISKKVTFQTQKRMKMNTNNLQTSLLSKKKNLLEMSNKRRVLQTNKVAVKNRLNSPTSYRNFPLPYLCLNLNKKEKNLTAQLS